MATITPEYVDQAETAIRDLPRDRNGGFKLTTTQLRVLLSLTAQLSDEAEQETSERLAPGLVDKVQYLRVRFLYQAGRDENVKAFVQNAKLLQALAEIGDSRAALLRFCRYMEALVAYKKYLDPNDK